MSTQQTQLQSPTQRPSPVLTVIFSALTVLLLAATCGAAYKMMHEVRKPHPELTPPSTTVRIHPDHLPVLVATALNHYEPISRSTWIPRSQSSAFRGHFSNIAAQKGWYANGDAGKLRIVMPRSDLHELDAMLEHPIPWVIDQQNETPLAKAPDNPDLVNVQVNILTNKRAFLLAPLALATLLLALMAALSAMHTRLSLAYSPSTLVTPYLAGMLSLGIVVIIVAWMKIGYSP